MTIEILPADHFTVQELTDLYNQTRVDYLVPMPMNADRLNEYIKDFDVDLRQSCVARDADGLRAGVLGGEGSVFCAGADLNWMSKMVAYSRDENMADSSRGRAGAGSGSGLWTVV